MKMPQGEALPEVIIVLGKTGVGKSNFIRAATGLNVEVGDSIKSCISTISLYEEWLLQFTNMVERYRGGANLSYPRLTNVLGRHAWIR